MTTLLSISMICPVCNEDKKKLQTCARNCVRMGACQFTDNASSTHPPPLPHVHVTCQVCGFMWLAKPLDEEGTKEAW